MIVWNDYKVEKVKSSLKILGAGFFILAACGAPSSQANDGAKFQGDWCWESGQEELTLALEQSGKNISGHHSAIGQQGAKVDEVADSEPPSIMGEATENTAIVTFHSGYPDSTGTGRARLSRSGKNLEWQIMESKGEHYLPQKVKLKPCTPHL